ncbi:hypothetical protein B0T14DRAFT_497674 [Immersiella caudata]|uniref:Wax synthase domain-containing protein n=1 Tax=Immersiella caudata TaxID=314043 RepID=A0AA39WJB4_9PEZI|nr:hypothetical protein B0T14DRAFT_497674 [Immersiella caudata]
MLPPLTHFALVLLAGWLTLCGPTKLQIPIAGVTLALGGTLLQNLGSAEANLSLLATDTIAKTTIIYLLHFTSILVLERWAIPSSDLPWRSRLYAAYKIMWNPRWVGTKLQPPNTPPPRPGSPGQTRLSFMVSRLVSIISLLIIDSLYTASSDRLLGFRTSDYHQHQTLTARQAAVRTNSVISSFFIMRPIAYVVLHNFLACVFVSLGLDEPHEWVPLFGRVSDAYTVRRYWSCFCDRLLYRPLTLWIRAGFRAFGYGTAARPLGGYGRALLNFLTFLASGLIHAWALRIDGQLCGYWEEVRFWCVHFCFVAAETLVELFVGGRSSSAPGTWRKVLGYLWVFGVFFWSVPRFQHVQMLCMPAHQREFVE